MMVVMKKREKNKTQEKQVMHNITAHHLLTKVIGSSQPTHMQKHKFIS